MDETAFPVPLYDMLWRADEFTASEVAASGDDRDCCRVHRPHGATTQQDRWEENGGYSPLP